ncbi:inclusion body family protein [Mucilaginibacter jinjuensis]|uniref:Inclusion body family protein n=1 Tax=Mucilaginibacter jinjuensis TaxID=1176721 RepID=A0ABY7TCW7_9SPHI|nr:inclusion body family protein [Mucilaginibacter jinjuensis]WCT13042.1 inclusion body family protein [Mucilaginibacter jinjuensis]
MALYSEFFTSQEIINIQVVIDTDAITNDYPNPSKDPAHPTGLPHNYMYMVATRANVIVGSGTGDLSIKADVGDIIRWYGTSEYGNFDSSVVLYKMERFAGDTVFNNLTFSVYKRQGVLPTDGSVFPINFSEQTYWFNQANVVNKGTENYNIQFALYTRQRGTANPVLFGYYYWDPTIVVKS